MKHDGFIDKALAWVAKNETMKVLKFSVWAMLLLALAVGGFSCDKGDDDVEKEKEKEEEKKGALVQILVKRKSGSNTLNNYTSLVVVSKVKDSMNFYKYDVAKVAGSAKKKAVLKGYDDLKATGSIIDTFYTLKGTYEDASTGRKSSSVELELDAGNYYVHVLDESLLKDVFEIKATDATTSDDLYTAELQQLGHVKVITRQGTVVGTDIDHADVRLYGYSSDTLNAALTGNNPADITVDYYYRVTTGKTKNENGNKESGIGFIFDIPVRSYYALAYAEGRGSNKDQPQKAVTEMVKNGITPVLLPF